MRIVEGIATFVINFQEVHVSRVVIVGAGLVGLTTALLLARDGHSVTIVERDPQPPPVGDAEAACRTWWRPGVSQLRLPHIYLPRWTQEMQRELPAVLTRLQEYGGAPMNFLDVMHKRYTGGWQPGDERFDSVAARRAVVEAALADVCADTPGLRVLRGAPVRSLIVEDGHPARVTGVIAGEQAVPADLVVACGGRSHQVTKLLADSGITVTGERVETGFIYYARHFARADGRTPQVDYLLLQHFTSVSVIVAPAEPGHWAVAIAATTADRELRTLRDSRTWGATMRLFPDAERLTDGTPVTDIQVMATTDDRVNHLVVDGVPVVTGLVAVGDAWATTSPLLGRGATIGLLHARLLRAALRESGAADPEQLVCSFAELTQQHIEPLWREAVWFARHRRSEMVADMAGVPYRPTSADWLANKAYQAAAPHNPALLRSVLGSAALLPRGTEAPPPPPASARIDQYPIIGPSRADLLAAIR